MSLERVEIDVSLHYRAIRHLGDADEEFVLTVECDIVGCPWCDDAAEGELKLGELKMYLIQIGNAFNAGESLPRILDIHQATADVGCAVFDSSFKDFCPWIKRRFDDAFPWEDVLILDRLTLIPEARGQQLGLAVLHQAINDWSSGCSLVAMKPFPLQYEGGGRNKGNITDLKLEGFQTGKAESFRKLRAYYVKLGFERIGRSDVFALSPKEKGPMPKALSISDKFSVPSDFRRRAATKPEH
jgi:hypothetical protein